MKRRARLAVVIVVPGNTASRGKVLRGRFGKSEDSDPVNRDRVTLDVGAMEDADGNDSSDIDTRVEMLSSPRGEGEGSRATDEAMQQAVAQRVKERLFGHTGPTQTLGRYTVLDVIGEGGMGTVLRAFDPQLDRQVAIKVLQGQLSHHDEARLRREAIAMAKLSHPNVVQVYEVGDSEEGIFVAMELVSGQTLGEWMGRAHDWRECVAAFIGLGEGLAAAHECGLVHRDFKPGNALIDTKGRPRVLDFGLARQSQSEPGASPDAPLAFVRQVLAVDRGVVANTPLTKTGTVVGTPAYMSPEQFYGEAVDARSDQFSFCATMYEALYGERPFGRGDLRTIMGRVSRHDVAAPPSRHGVPRALRKLLLRGLAPTPDARWSSMDELLGQLRELVAPARYRWVTASLAVGLAFTSGSLLLSTIDRETDEPSAHEAQESRPVEPEPEPEPDVPIQASEDRRPAAVEQCPDDPALALCMSFESVDGKVVRDGAHPEIRGLLSGDATIGEGPFGNALVMPGKDGRVILDTVVDPPGSFSIDGWIWMAKDSPVWAGIVDKWVQYSGYWLGGTADIGGLAFWVDGISISTEDVPKEQWIHVAGTFDIDSGVMSLYIDGELVALGQHSGPATPSPSVLALGYAVLDDTPFRGKLEALRIWNRVLTEAELLASRPPRD